MQLPFYVMIVAMTLFFITVTQFEMANKNARAQLRALKRRLGGDETPVGRSAAPSLPTPTSPDPSVS